MKKLLLFTLIIITSEGISQPMTNQYVVLTFDSDRNKDRHPPGRHFWIAPIDSIKGFNDVKLYPVYLDLEYSSNSYDDCCLGKTIDFMTTTTATRYDYNEYHKKQVELIYELVISNRKKIQTINKKWEKGYREKVQVFATPIRGEFCACNIAGLSLRFTDGRDLIYIPNQNFEFLNDFWETEESKDLIYSDFSNINFWNYH